MYNKIIYNKIEELWNKYKLSGELNHGGEKGLLREMFVSALLRSILPMQYAIGSGIIVDKWERQSSQCDIIIYDKRVLPPIVEENGHGVFPFDSVLRVIEVKSNLDCDGLRQFCDSSKKLQPTNQAGLKIAARGKLFGGQTFYPLNCLFAYKTSIANGFRISTSNDCDNIGVIIACENGEFTIKDGIVEIPSNHDLKRNIMLFLIKTLDSIEETANSRSNFRLRDWMSDQVT